MIHAKSARQTVDPFTVEIISEGLAAITDEMFVTTQRTSHSTIVYEVLDFAVGLTNASGQIVTQGNGVTMFLTLLSSAAERVLEKHGNTLQPGDIFMTNDPYVDGGTHLSDVTLVLPVFYEGELIAFAANKAHWTEVGGMAAGSVTTHSREVFQEGLQFPCIRVFRAGEPEQGILDFIAANVRVPTMSIGDLYGQAASVRLADQRINELCAKYGIDLVRTAMRTMLDRSAERARIELGKIPAGTYTADDWLDRDENGGPYPIRVTVTISEEEFICDFTGTHPQLPHPINASRIGLESAVRVAFKALLDPHAPQSAGTFAPLTVVCPPGTVFSAERPAPVSLYWESMARVADLVWRAVAPAVPHRVTAGHFTSVCADLISGRHPETGDLFILFEPNAGGWGAGPGKDGERGLVAIGDGETYIIPVEVAEMKYGVLVEEYSFNVDGAGAGEWRGGEGIVRDYRITADTADAIGICGRHTYPAWGMAGGHDGSTNAVEFVRADSGERRAFGMSPPQQLRAGDHVRIVSATGGGWGNPLHREPELVAEDVRNGFVTVEAACETYGVIIDPRTGAVEGATDARQAARSPKAS